MYSQAVADENYLRGVQEADANGVVTFQSIYPAAYSGRWPHIHFEVYPSLDLATDEVEQDRDVAGRPPEDASDAVYATAGYEQSVATWPRPRSTRTTCSVTTVAPSSSARSPDRSRTG